MNRFSLGLALIACAASAAEAEDYSYNSPSRYSSQAYSSTPNYGSSSHSHSSVPNYGSSSASASSSSSHNHSAPSYSRASSSHGHGGYSSSPSYGHSQQYAPSYGGHGHSHGYGHQHGYGGNPWGVATTAKSGWWSSQQQYSPPQIPYKPYEGVNAPIFARCDMVPGYITATTAPTDSFSADTNDIVIEFAQLPHQPISVKTTHNVIGNTPVPTTGQYQYSYKIREFADLGRAADNSQCNETGLGKEYNPLNEIDKYGRSNPFQDPQRGSIDTQELPTAAVAPAEVYQSNLLANLAGPESIMGMSVQVTRCDESVPPLCGVIGCCPITRATAPTTYSPYASSYPYYAGGHSHGGHTHAQSHAHGYY